MRKEFLVKFVVFVVLLFVPIGKQRRMLRRRWLDKYKKSCFHLDEKVKLDFNIEYPPLVDCPEKFSLPDPGGCPLVSIIIPVYNQYNYTKLCLWSILKNTRDIKYEIIIADDHSGDETKNIDKNISNIKVVRQSGNKGFILNCNAAASAAMGKYILFLNNDTQVQKDWLLHLLSIIESDENIGMAGCKIIFPDNSLQEAGSIVFKDGSARNYNRGEYFKVSSSCYVKEVDYVSGCAVILRKSDWDELGGFDLQYIPAYYEDTDLAFSVREKLGKKVILQPLSVVMHFEGITCGTDTTVGVKSYQVTNKEKFYTKWKDVLEREQAELTDVFRARDRSLGKKTLLFVDYGILHYALDAGSRASFQYLQYFVREGYNVKFLPVFRSEYDSEYIESHQQLGVEVLHDVNFEDWIREYGSSMDYIYLNRPDVSLKVLDSIKQHSHAKILYQGHDLHHLRIMRQYEQSGLEKDKKEAIRFKQIEKEVFSRVDVVCMFSSVETEMVRTMEPSVETAVVPLYILDPGEMKSIDYNAWERRDVMFIGGFGHKPNMDAVIWFVNKVWPLVRKSLPDLVFNIVGSNPPENIKNLANSRIKVWGTVSDEELKQIYRTVRMSIIPLRFGAGVKGKVVEAIFNKVPVLTTSIGAEGINNDSDILTIEDDPVSFAAQLISMYGNERLLESISSQSEQFISKEFSHESARMALKGYM